MLVNMRLPNLTSLERNPEVRNKKVYLDYLQNRKGQTMAAAYCLRPRKGAPVSTPLEWKELTKKIDPLQFNLKTIFTRLEKKGDLWKGMLEKGKEVDLRSSIALLEEILQKNRK